MRKTLCVCYALMLLSIGVSAQTVKPSVERFIQSPESFQQAVFEGQYYVDITFDELPDRALLAKLKSKGIQLVNFQSGTTFLATVPTKNRTDLFKGININQVAVPAKREKIASAIMLRDIPQHAKRGGGQISTVLVFHEHISTSTIQRLLSSNHISVIQNSYRNGKTLVVETDIATAEQLADHPAIAYVDIEQEPDQLLNYEVNTQQGTNVLRNRNGAYLLDGTGITIGVGDGGKLGNHIDFDNRANNIATNSYSSFGDHGDHVAGIISGGGHINPRHTGIAPASELLIQKTSLITYYTADYWNNYGMVLTNNSYGTSANCNSNGEYNYTSQNLDKQLIDFPKVLHVFAAGNSGGSTCAPYPKGYKTVLKYYQSAKNVLTVGNVKENLVANNGSSRGPVADGRLKPEICGIGSNVYSTSRDFNYTKKSGTSMAAPAVTGTLALMNEAYREANNDEIPDGALMKAIACNTAKDLGNPGPDYIYGFGLINGKRAVDVIQANQFFNHTIEQGAQQEQTISVTGNTSQLNVLLYWHDKEAEPFPTKALVNDLDLEIVDPNGNVVRPWILNPDTFSVDQPAVRGIDTLNNIEQVTISNPMAGNYTIRVKGSGVAFGPQPYYVTYHAVANEVQLTYPYGGEQLQPAAQAYLTWNAPMSNTTNFELEFSLDNGATWINIASNIDAAERTYLWTVPNNFTTTGLVRITCPTTDNVTSQNATPFSIHPVPANVAGEALCNGIINLTWDTMDDYAYEISYYNGAKMAVLDTVNNNSILINDVRFLMDSTYWFAVRAIATDGSGSIRSTALALMPQLEGNCPWENDVSLQWIGINEIGRAATSIALSDQEEVLFMIYNLGANPTTTIEATYQINGATSVTETITTPIAVGDSLLYTFRAKADLSQPGQYDLDGWIAGANDTANDNDGIIGQMQARQLPNNTVSFSPGNPLMENFQSAQTGLYETTMTGLSGIENWDYQNSTAESRLEIDETTGSVRLLPRVGSLSEQYDNKLIWTVNLSQINPVNGDLVLSFNYQNELLDALSNPTGHDNRILVRGSDQDSWLEVLTITGTTENWQAMEDINLSTILNASGQSLTSSFQVQFQQRNENGLALDNVELSQVFPLPISLNHFKAEIIKNDVLLTWDTSSETNNDYFDIELAVGDEAARMGDFQPIGTVRGNGTTNISNQYEFMDDQADKTGNRYYRLKQVDYDGTFTHSPVRMVTFPVSFEATVYPNPFSSVLKIHYQTNTAKNLTVQLVNLQNQVVATQQVHATEGTQTLELSLDASLPAGFYYLHIPEETSFTPKRVIKHLK